MQHPPPRTPESKWSAFKNGYLARGSEAMHNFVNNLKNLPEAELEQLGKTLLDPQYLLNPVAAMVPSSKQIMTTIMAEEKFASDQIEKIIHGNEEERYNALGQLGFDSSAAIAALLTTKGIGFFAEGGEGASLYAESDRVDLYRAVKPNELTQVLNDKHFINPFGIERKYFSSSLAGAQQYARMAEQGFGDPPYVILKTSILRQYFDALSPDLKETVDRGINAVLIPTQQLHILAVPEVLTENLIEEITDRSIKNVNP